jgi:hypothetical protein
MLEMAHTYRQVIDDITANKALKLRRYELYDEDWTIVEDLICVLKVCQVDATRCKLTDARLAIQRSDIVVFSRQSRDYRACHTDHGSHR